MQRGNRGERAFFVDNDYLLYRDLIATSARAAGTAVWAYCLMPSQVDLVLLPADPDGLRRALAETHRRYTTAINTRQGWTGPLWQGRYQSVTLDEPHLRSAVLYLSQKPVLDGLVANAADWPWSSVRAHLAGQDDGLVSVAPVLERVPDLKAALAQAVPEAVAVALRRAVGAGRPLGDAGFLDALEARLGRPLRPRKRGPKPRSRR